jgi:hypothetical protein
MPVFFFGDFAISFLKREKFIQKRVSKLLTSVLINRILELFWFCCLSVNMTGTILAQNICYHIITHWNNKLLFFPMELLWNMYVHTLNGISTHIKLVSFFSLVSNLKKLRVNSNGYGRSIECIRRLNVSTNKTLSIYL